MLLQQDIAFSASDTAIAGGLIAALMAMAAVALVIGLAVYIYMAFAWMTIAKKLDYDKAWLAWIPIANYFLLPILAKKHWAWGFMFLVPLANLVFAVIWMWNIFEQRKYPGWLSLVPIASIIPVLGWIAGPAFLVIIGFVAWKDN